jgi:hypothetical protein
MSATVWHQTATIVAIFAGVLFGSAAISSACWVWIKRQLFAYGGSALCFSGVILIGLSIWQSVEFGITEKGMTFKAQALLEQANQSATQANTAAEDAHAAATAGNQQKAAAAAAASAKAAQDTAAAVQRVTRELNPAAWRF